MHGLGNDFILIDALGQKVLPRLDLFCRRYSDRRFGIGFDQALVLLPSTVADFKMEIYNADGSRVEMCGNGIRCLAKYIWDRRLSEKDEIAVETLAGIIRPVKAGELIRVDMGPPVLDGPAIPVNIEGEIIRYPLRIIDRDFEITCLSMGNPHAVIFLEEIQSLPIDKYGPAIERHPLFPKRINVEFVQVGKKHGDPLASREKGSHERVRKEGVNSEEIDEISLRVWERGAGETLACGTGACASVVASCLNGFTGRRVTVHLPGGDLLIDWSEGDNHVYMTGPAVEVYKGEVIIETTTDPSGIRPQDDR